MSRRGQVLTGDRSKDLWDKKEPRVPHPRRIKRNRVRFWLTYIGKRVNRALVKTPCDLRDLTIKNPPSI
ncbi:hypothetical protein BVX98_05265 [bacterium F11]|nr:hypothetical protein BVX98_05265 [bacterium F11]